VSPTGASAPERREEEVAGYSVFIPVWRINYLSLLYTIPTTLYGTLYIKHEINPYHIQASPAQLPSWIPRLRLREHRNEVDPIPSLPFLQTVHLSHQDPPSPPRSIKFKEHRPPQHPTTSSAHSLRLAFLSAGHLAQHQS